MLAPALTDPDARQWAILVRECRRNLGLKQLAFADLLGASQSAVSRWEAGAQLPGYAMQNKVRDLLHKPLYNDRADRVLVAQIRQSLGRVSLNSADLSFTVVSPAILKDHDGEAGFRRVVENPVFRGHWRDQVASLSWRTPVFSPDVVAVTGINAWVRVEDGELVVKSYVRCQSVPLRLSSGQWVLRVERVDIPAAEGKALFGTRPEVLTLDDVA